MIIKKKSMLNEENVMIWSDLIRKYKRDNGNGCLVTLMEIDKALAGIGGTGNNDGGTTKRSLAQLLKFLSDERPEGVYVCASCNDITALTPEWLRSGRWDCVFMVDLPSEDEQKEILKYYINKYKVKGNPPQMEGWSGAEIETLCRMAAMMSRPLEDVSSFVIPISKTMDREIKNLRTWAKDRTVPASKFKLTKPSKETKRSINLN